MTPLPEEKLERKFPAKTAESKSAETALTVNFSVVIVDIIIKTKKVNYSSRDVAVQISSLLSSSF
jgi:hypothetical protein